MNMPAQSLAQNPAPAQKKPHPQIPIWLSIPLGLLVLAFLGISNNPKILDALPKTFQPKPTVPLSEVLPGRWDIHAKDGYHYVVSFGRHSEMSLVMDIPAEYRARLNLEQMWIGGNYHLSEGDVVDVKLTDGRFAVILAQLHGLTFRHVVVNSFTQESLNDSEGNLWKRIGNAPNGPLGEAHDIAEEAAPANLPAAVPVKSAAEIAAAQRLQKEHAKLSAAYAKLEKRRRALNPKDAKALAAFNKDAADYSQQVAKLTAQTTATPNPGNAATATNAAPGVNALPVKATGQ